MDIFTGILGGFEPFVSLLGGFIFKYLANQQQMLVTSVEQMGKRIGHSSDAADRAAKRGGENGPWIRRFIVVMIFSTLCGGAILAAFLTWETTYIYTTEVKDRLFGLFQTGGKVKTITAEGFVLTPEMRRVMVDIVFFYFGVSTAKLKL
jgi:hypothetical protein